MARGRGTTQPINIFDYEALAREALWNTYSNTDTVGGWGVSGAGDGI